MATNKTKTTGRLFCPLSSTPPIKPAGFDPSLATSQTPHRSSCFMSAALRKASRLVCAIASGGHYPHQQLLRAQVRLASAAAALAPPTDSLQEQTTAQQPSSTTDKQNISTQQAQGMKETIESNDDVLGINGSHDRFIPVTRSHLTETLLKHLAENEQQRFQYLRIGSLLKGVIHSRFHALMEELKALYDPHDPDKDTVFFQQMSDEEREQNEKRLLEMLSHILDKANFDLLPNEQVVQTMRNQQFRDGIKINVNMNRFKTLRVWVRGEMETTVMKAWSQSMWDKVQEMRGVPVEPRKMYQRCIIACRTNDEQLYLKLYKDVLEDQLEQLLPKTKVVMSDLDRLLVGGSLAVAATTSAMHMSQLTQGETVSLVSVVLLSALALGFRGWTSVNNKHNKYLADQMKTLYYQNINNNRGLIALLVDRAEDEEFKEIALGYAFLNTMQFPVRVPALTRRIENWLFSEFRVQVCFDAHDSLQKMQQLHLIEMQGDVITSVLPTDKALALLENMRNHELHRISAALKAPQNS